MLLRRKLSSGASSIAMVLDETEENDLVMISWRWRVLRMLSKLSKSSVCFSRFFINCSTFSRWADEVRRSGLMAESSMSAPDVTRMGQSNVLVDAVLNLDCSEWHEKKDSETREEPRRLVVVVPFDAKTQQRPSMELSAPIEERYIARNTRRVRVIAILSTGHCRNKYKAVK